MSKNEITIAHFKAAASVLILFRAAIATSCRLDYRLDYKLCRNKSLIYLNGSYLLFLPLQVLVVNAQGDITRVNTRSKDVVMKGTLSQYFKLGQEGKYRVYHNQYSSNAVALNKHQHREASSMMTCWFCLLNVDKYSLIK